MICTFMILSSPLYAAVAVLPSPHQLRLGLELSLKPSFSLIK
jgi:hypothetical protein